MNCCQRPDCADKHCEWVQSTALFTQDGGHEPHLGGMFHTPAPKYDREKVAVGIWLAVAWAVCTALAKWLGAPITFL